MLLVVDLEAEDVLEVVAGLLVVEAGDHSGAFGNVKYLQPACLRQPSGGGVDSARWSAPGVHLGKG
jgi:hypothetical protein